MTSILIVDDDVGDLEILSRAFAATGQMVEVTKCNEVSEAYAWLDRRDQSDLGSTIVVTDLNMPRIDGFEFIRALREREEPPPVIIVLSTSARSQDIDRAYKLGANAYHTKPMGFAETTQLCQSIIAYWTGAAHLPRASPVVKSLVYVSNALEEFDRRHLEDLALRATTANRVHNVTGFLVSDKGQFFQYIEGPQEGLETIYRRISADDRHSIVRHVMLGSGRRRFSGWSMNVLGANGVDERPLRELFQESMTSVAKGDNAVRASGPVMELTSRMASVHQWVGGSG